MSMTDKPACATRLMAVVVFAGDFEPSDPAGAAVSLARNGFEVCLMPEIFARCCAIRATTSWR